MKLVHAAYEPAGEGPFPTIFAMHGWGSNAMDLHGLAPYIANGQFLVICPQGAIDVEIGAVNGYGWYQTNPGARPDEEKIDAAVAQLAAFINEACQRYPVDRSKIAAVGFSQGGMMAYNLIVRWPKRFAAFAGIGTAFPDFLLDRATDREAFAQLPVLIEHGRADEAIPMKRARKTQETLTELGFPVTFRDYDCGHEVAADGVRDLSAFLTEKVLKP
ncbi:MAG TPA: dienelactone hydrolase family protein [Candidatus Binataceae bacterium]|nr:dienelactone hydrolase family protein [Candidatus Binataceae bacterium]